MASNAVIGALRINLGMNSAEFHTKSKGVNKGLDRLERKVKGVAKAVAAAGAAMAASLSTAFVGLAKHADDMTKTAQKIGIPVEELSKLAHAADLSGVSFQSLQNAVGRLSQNITDSITGMATEGSRALESLGISLKDASGATRSTSEIIGDIAERFSTMRDGSEKTAIAMRVFGRAGRDMIPLLNQGRDGLRAMTDEAQRLGLDLTQRTGQAAERFNDNLTRMGAALRGVGLIALERIAPAMAALTDRLVAATTQGGMLENVANVLAGAFNGLVRVVMAVINNMDILVQWFKVFVALKIAAAALKIGVAFVQMARAIRTAGVVMFVFNKVRRASMLGLIGMAAIVAKLTGKLDDLTGWIKETSDRVLNLLPEDAVSKIKGTAQDLFGDLNLETDNLNKSLEAVGNTANKIAAPVGRAATSLAGVGKAAKGAAAASEDAWAGLRKVSREASSNAAPAFDNLQFTYDSWIDSAVDGTFRLNHALKDLAKQLSATFAKNSLKSIFSIGTGKKFSFSSLFAGFFAEGGTIPSGQFGVVGEAGEPELVTGPATVTPLNKLMGGGVAETIRIDIRTDEAFMNAQTDRRIRTASGQIIAVSVQQSQEVMRNDIGNIMANEQARNQ
ncbi:MAG: hypothetical protein AAF468_12615 [Pseudomonadota bacterium]